MSSRVKAPSLASRAAFERAIDDLARTVVALRHLEARRDAELQRVRADFEPGVCEAGARIDALTLLVEKFAEENREELLPGKQKSAETALAVYGFRTGLPTLALLSRGWTWAKVLDALDARRLKRFIRLKREPDKEQIKLRIKPANLAKIGCKIAQDEEFFVSPKDKPSEQAAG